MRGEYGRSRGLAPTWWELPPRARRIHPNQPRRGKIPGTTSACAENTRDERFIGFTNRNYLRVRGEYAPWIRSLLGRLELPPRARRIPDQALDGGRRLGTTSACAENTSACYPRGGRFGNYLRVRGEYPTRPRRSAHHLELPPRARRIRPSSRGIIINIGTTSACAENTCRPCSAPPHRRNYLRVRGEY